MNQSSDAAEQIVRLSLEGVEVAAKITGSGAKNIAVLLYTIMKDKEQTSGKAKLSNMLKSGKPLTIFTVKKDDLEKFQEEAKRYGILYCALVDKKNKSGDGLVDIVVRKEDSARINRIVERFKFANFNKADIISEIQKTREEQNIGKEQNPKEPAKQKNKNKETKSLNPNLAKTEKSPLSKPFSEVQKTSTREGSAIKKKPSVRVKLGEYKVQANKQRKQETLNINKTPKKSKGKNR